MEDVVFKQYKFEGKVCGRCKIYKPVSEYAKSKRDGIQSRCRPCKTEDRRVKRSDKESNDRINARRREIWATDEHSRNTQLATAKKWRKTNPEKASESVYKSLCKRFENDPFFKFVHRLRSRTSGFIKSKKISKNNKFIKYLGCDLETFKKHIESQFRDGMNWENHSVDGWHLDHIIPISKAETEEDLYRLCHYTNLQPLWAEDNLRKSNKILIEEAHHG